MKTIFFYGLFMDKDLLIAKGLHPSNSRIAYVMGYGLRIGDRATLENSASERAFGSIMQLHNEELELLYSEKSVADYIPEEITAIDDEGHSLDVISYILPMENVSGSNSKYAKALSLAARKIGLPIEYVAEIEKWI
jgi:hypothetical protein